MLNTAPVWMLDLVAPLPMLASPSPSMIVPAKAAGTTPYGRSALYAETAKVAGTGQGGRNHALNVAAFVIGQLIAGGQIDLAEAENELLVAANRAGLAEAEVMKTIKSGFQAGAKVPRTAPEKPNRKLQEVFIEAGKVALDEWIPATPKPWPVLDRAALPGLVGDFVDLATENSEADPAAVNTTFIIRFACEAGGPNPATRAHINIGDSRHEPRLFAVVAGKSSKARKGTSAAPINRLFGIGDNGLPMAMTSPGPLSSGEGVVHHVRDELQSWEIDKKTHEGSWVVKEPGIPDKRLFICDEELAAALRCMKREGNTLSAILRGLWDNGTLHSLTKSVQTKTTKAHVNIVAHITLEELSRSLDEVELFNGFANRFLWILARRTRLVSRPLPMPARELAGLQNVLIDRLSFAHNVGLMQMSADTCDLWDCVYPALSIEQSGLFGAVIGRAEAQVQRLAMVYALVDGSAVVECQHLEAALAFWRFTEASAAYIFEGRQADPVRDKILAALRQAPGCMSATALHRALGNNTSQDQFKAALNDLTSSGLVVHKKEATKTKPKNLFYLNEKNENYELSPPSDGTPEDNSYNSYNSQGSKENGGYPELWDGPAEVEI